MEELGNELHDLHYGVERLPNSPVPPREWTAGIAATLRAWDANHWLVDDGDFLFLPSVLGVAEIDMVGSTFVESRYQMRRRLSIHWFLRNGRSPANLQKAFCIKEFGPDEPAAGIPDQDAAWLSHHLKAIRATNVGSSAGALLVLRQKL